MLCVLANTGVGDHSLGPLLLALAVVVAVGKLGGDLAIRARQPAVLGELVAGVVLGNLGLVGLHAFEGLRTEPALATLAELGVILLLFEVGLASTVREMTQVGRVAFLVAVLGVVAPMLLGFGVGALLLPEASVYTHVFLGAALTATSVGITARVFRDLGASETKEARIVLGAAVVDDVLGLVVLAATVGLIGAANGGGSFAGLTLAGVVLKAFGFLIGALVVGSFLVPRFLRASLRLQGTGLLLSAALVLCFGFSWAAAVVGLAPIVGAFAAGLVLEPVHYRQVAGKDGAAERPHELEELLAPLTAFLAPIFFVLMGLKVELAVFAEAKVLLLSAALTLVAVLGKQVCGLVVGWGGSKGVDRLTIGFGMIPRGEVGLIFANMGVAATVHGAPVFSHEAFSAVVIMVILTTLATPPALRWSLARKRRGHAGELPA